MVKPSPTLRCLEFNLMGGPIDGGTVVVIYDLQIIDSMPSTIYLGSKKTNVNEWAWRTLPDKQFCIRYVLSGSKFEFRDK